MLKYFENLVSSVHMIFHDFWQHPSLFLRLGLLIIPFWSQTGIQPVLPFSSISFSMSIISASYITRVFKSLSVLNKFRFWFPVLLNSVTFLLCCRYFVSLEAHFYVGNTQSSVFILTISFMVMGGIPSEFCAFHDFIFQKNMALFCFVYNTHCQHNL